MNRHRPDPPTPQGPPGSVAVTLKRNVAIHVVLNLATAVTLAAGRAGNSPALAFLKLVFPLWMWAFLFALVAALMLTGQYTAAHTIAVVTWLMLALGAVLGVAQGLSSAPAGSSIFAALVLAVAATHVNVLVFRRKEALARRARP